VVHYLEQSSQHKHGLYLSDNLFTGIIPEQLCDFESLKALFLDGNEQRTGSIPPCLSQLVNLSAAI